MSMTQMDSTTSSKHHLLLRSANSSLLLVIALLSFLQTHLKGDKLFDDRYDSLVAVIEVVEFARTNPESTRKQAPIIQLLSPYDGRSSEFWSLFAESAMQLSNTIEELEDRHVDNALVLSIGTAIDAICSKDVVDTKSLIRLCQMASDGMRTFVRETLIHYGYRVDGDCQTISKFQKKQRKP